MASLRRTKNFANDGQTPMFLYTILKQLDLRSIDWNLVASSLDISNGHAARMRYSRMRQQFEGLSNQPKPPKAKKEKDGESKSSKDKGKGKRQLLEEENERLAKQRISGQNDVKKPRLESSAYIDPSFTSSMESTGRQYVSPMWNQPMVKIEPPSEFLSVTNNTTPSTVIKKEPEASATVCDNERSTSPIVKQEPTTTPLASQEMSAVTPVAIKKEVDAVLPHGAFSASTPFNSTPVPIKKEADAVVPHGAFSTLTPFSSTSAARNYRFPNVASPYMNSLDPAHYMNSYALPMGSSSASSGYSMPQSVPGYSYHPFMYHNANPWSHPVAEQKTSSAIAPTAESLSLNPLASSYEELLNMPLYVRHATPGDAPAQQSRRGLQQLTDDRSEFSYHGNHTGRVSGVETNYQGTNSTTTDSLQAAPSANLDTASSATVIEADSDAECEIDNGTLGGNDTKEITVKREPTEVS